MVATTLNGVLLTGDHASRPAASAVAKGTLYACSTHGLIYQSDASSWTTWATLGTAASGSITSSGYTQNTAKLLGRTTASSGAIEEISVGSGLTLSAGSLSASGGSGLTQAFVGYNTVGGSVETPGVNSKAYVKKVTLANDCLITSIDCHISPNSGEVSGPSCMLYSDNAGVPDVLLAHGPRPSLLKAAGDTYRWVATPLGVWVPAADYWIGVRLADLGAGTLPHIHYDGSGSDRTVTGGTSTHWDWGSYSSPTTTSNKYSIRANTIR